MSEATAKSAHTRGPWTVCSGDGGRLATIETTARGKHNDDLRVADCPGPDRSANARLIAAAPDLLAACKATVARIQGVFDDRDLVSMGPLSANTEKDVLRYLGDAIAKAEGVAS